MTQPPTILIGVSKKKMNRLLHSKNEIYYYLINDTLRKVFCTLFDALGNISSRNDYYSFIKKYVQFKTFSKCNTPNLLRHSLSIKEGMVIAIDNITRELYLPSQHEFDCISLQVNYPSLIPQNKNDFIKDIVEEHYMKQYKDQLQNVLTELQHKSSMKPVLNEMIDKNRKKQCREQLQKVLNMLIHKLSMKPVLTEIKKVNVPKVEVEVESDCEDYEKYEDDFEVDFGENESNESNEYEYEYSLLEEPKIDFVKEELDDALDSVVDELKEVMTLAIQSLPKAKPASYPPTIVIDEEDDEENDQENDDKSFSASFSGKDEEKEEEKEEEFVVQKVDSISEAETSLEKSLPSTVEFLEVKEAEAEVEVPNVFLVEAVQEVINAVAESVEEAVEKVEAVVESVEETVDAAVEAALEDDVEEISKEEFEPLKSSTLVNDLFQKYQKDTKPEEEVKKPEPPKSYISSMWSYLGWKSK